ncbi:hypothetical protein ACFYRJ_28515 [Streptomyces sp. NPDC005531]|uniref:hypothetical protein n=1 Tax=Streptomyces sp. NPDC005531 TaxID=3364722 RepID=UPI0036C585B5
MHFSPHLHVLGQFVAAALVGVLAGGAVEHRVHGPSATGRAVRAIQRDHRGGMSMREPQRKRKVMWRTVRKALNSARPEPGEKRPARESALDPNSR